MNRTFLIWWLIAVVQAIAVGIAVYFDAIQFLIDNDVTKFSFVIITIWATATLIVGYRNFKQKINLDLPFFMAESCMTIGMVGTVIGFMLMLGSSFANIDPSNVDSMKQVITDMASGMSTALLTTLCGLVASLFVKVQIVMQEEEHG